MGGTEESRARGKGCSRVHRESTAAQITGQDQRSGRRGSDQRAVGLRLVCQAGLGGGVGWFEITRRQNKVFVKILNQRVTLIEHPPFIRKASL